MSNDMYLWNARIGYHSSNSRQANNWKEALRVVKLEKVDEVKVASKQGVAGSVPKKKTMLAYHNKNSSTRKQNRSNKR